MTGVRWQLLPRAPLEHFSRMAGIPPLIAQLLHNRGITNLAEVEPFIAGNEQLLGDPFNLPDIEKAVRRIRWALLRGESIAVYGDFDADGITATALLCHGLATLGGRVVPYIPHRLEEGYGLNHTALKGLLEQGVTLMVTADCGITAVEEVAQAQRMGLDVIITDHHLVADFIPPAVAAVDPKRNDSSYPFRELAGVGVAFKLLQALFQTSGEEIGRDDFLDLVAVGTVADLAPLLGENRYLVKRGLEVLNRTNRLGLQALVRQAGLKMGSLDTSSIAYILGPHLNATGRLDHAIVGYELLMTKSVERANELAALLEAKNAERQRLTAEILAKVKDKISAFEPLPPLLFVGGEDYPAGVVGVVASKLADELYRPVLILELGAEVSRGSARSIPEFNITAALARCRDLLSRFGGHAQAAGFTLPSDNIVELHRRLLEMAKSQLATVDLRPALVIDAEVRLASLNGEIIRLLGRLAPFGQANPVPCFLSRGVKVVDCQTMGAQGDHLKLKLRDGDVTWPAVAFGQGNSNEIAPYLDIVYAVEVDAWGGGEELRLNILDFATHTH